MIGWLSRQVRAQNSNPVLMVHLVVGFVILWKFTFPLCVFLTLLFCSFVVLFNWKGGTFSLSKTYIRHVWKLAALLPSLWGINRVGLCDRKRGIVVICRVNKLISELKQGSYIWCLQGFLRGTPKHVG